MDCFELARDFLERKSNELKKSVSQGHALRTPLKEKKKLTVSIIPSRTLTIINPNKQKKKRKKTNTNKKKPQTTKQQKRTNTKPTPNRIRNQDRGHTNQTNQKKKKGGNGKKAMKRLPADQSCKVSIEG